MLEHDIAMPAGWQAAWLERTLPSLHCYTTILSYSCSMVIILLGVGGFIAIRHSTKRLAVDTNNRKNVFSMMNKKLLKVTKGHFSVANIYMFHVLVITMVDAVICGITLGKDASSDPETWTKRLLIETVLYCSYLLAIFVATFLLVPLLQMLLVTWALARFSNKHPSNTLADYIPEARFFSTHIAQIWCMMSFFVVSWWAPSSGNSFWRYVILQACLGSALAWLEASFVFNFRADQLQSKDLHASNGGVREILRLFTKTVHTVHVQSEKTEWLPKYEAISPYEGKAISEEEKGFR